MKISEVSRMTGLADSSIRYYEKNGLLKPNRNKDSAYREFSKEDVEILMGIIVLRRAGFPINEIKRIMNGDITFEKAIDNQKKELERESKDLASSIQLCEQLSNIDSFESMNQEKYFLYTEEEVLGGTTYKKIDEWTDGMLQLVQKAFDGNPFICYVAMHQKLKYAFILCLFIFLPVIIFIGEIIEPSVWGLVPYLVIYGPIFIAYIMYKKYA